MGLEDPGSIEASQVVHIVNAVLECALPKRPQTKPGTDNLVKENSPVEEHDSSEPRLKEARPRNKPNPS